ncbi:hypothetical protein [Pseudomonas viridiflava]|uniref:hypothetical protein n=1 Tax=Pseudomonas viridiflava TaxID=33069 RepID=UPI000F039F9A|nr:hypothetical protein [Pseudomonas viridiflava]
MGISEQFDVAVGHSHSKIQSNTNLRLPFTADIKSILGTQSYCCMAQAAVLRSMGYEIDERAGDEQAATIHWMLTHYLHDPENWRANMKPEFDSAFMRFSQLGK